MSKRRLDGHSIRQYERFVTDRDKLDLIFQVSSAKVLFSNIDSGAINAVIGEISLSLMQR